MYICRLSHKSTSRVNIYAKKSSWKIWLFASTMVVVAGSLLYTYQLSQQLAEQEETRMQMLGEFIKAHSYIPDTENYDFTQLSRTMELNNTIPIIWTSDDDIIMDVRNFGIELDQDKAFFQQELEDIKKNGHPPVIITDKVGNIQKLYYKGSSILTQIRWFPIIQFLMIFMLALLAYMAFNTAKRLEQNLVWVGMSKETAHQMGTPMSSLIGWIENMKHMFPENQDLMMISAEMEKDVDNLRLVSDRFSKIGSTPKLMLVNLHEALTKSMEYMKLRAARKIIFNFPESPPEEILILANPILLDWVVENLIKNALDSMENVGSISISMGYNEKNAWFEVVDTGKGIPKSKWKTIFMPGYTTKMRGWGLGLSLTRRIVTEYHKGKIFVKESEKDKGTTFRVEHRRGS